MQFGDDWPGVFFRGDNALYFMLRLRDVLQRSNITDMDRIVLSQLADLLGSCEVGGKEPPDPQLMRGFSAARAPDRCKSTT